MASVRSEVLVLGGGNARGPLAGDEPLSVGGGAALGLGGEPGPLRMRPLAMTRYPCEASSRSGKRVLAPSSEQPPLPQATTPSLCVPSASRFRGRYTTWWGREATSSFTAG